MKLKLTALAAITLVTLSAQAAEPNVTVFGVIDMGLFTQNTSSNPALGYLPNKTNNGKVTALKDGGIGQSFWGVRGSEDLGGGLKANFNLQGNFQSDTGTFGGPNSSGTTSLFNQQANIGLSGDFGAFQMGRVISPMYFAMQSTDVRGAAYFGSVLTALVAVNSATGAFTGANSNVPVGTIYNDNALVYTTPTFNGFTAAVEYTLGEVAGNGAAQRQTAATLMYNANNLKLDALYYNGNDNGIKNAPTPNGTNTNRLISFGAMYTLNAVSMSAGYFKGKNRSNPGAGVNPPTLGGGATTGEVNMVSLGLGYRISPQINVTFGAYRVVDQNNTANKSLQYALGLDYALSKRTTLYVEGAHVNNEGSNMNQAPGYGQPVTAGVSTTAMMAGIRHRF